MNQPHRIPDQNFFKRLAYQHMVSELQKSIPSYSLEEFLDSAFHDKRVWFVCYASRRDFMLLWARAFHRVQSFYWEKYRQAKDQGDFEGDWHYFWKRVEADRYFRHFRPVIENFNRNEAIEKALS